MPFPEEEKPQPLQAPLQPRPFISLVTDALTEEYKNFQSYLLPLAERVRAGHRLLSVAAHELAKKGEEQLASQIIRFVESYIPPRIRFSHVVSTDELPVLRVFLGGEGEAYSDFPMHTPLEEARRAVEDQRYESYYNTVLAPRVGAVMSKLAEKGIIREHPRQLAPTFTHITAPLAESPEEEESEDA